MVNKKKILGIGLVSTIILGLLYALLRYLNENGIITSTHFWEMFNRWGLIFITFILGTILIIYLIIYFTKEDKDDKELQPPKQPVDIGHSYKPHTALFLWFQEFIIASGIPHSLAPPPSKEEEYVVKLHDYQDLSIYNGKKYDDSETGDNFYRFEALAKKGTYIGLNIVQIPIDKGEEYIRRNCLFWIKHNTPLEMLRRDRDFPLTSVQDQNLRIEIMRMRLEEEGDYKESQQLKSFKVKPASSDQESVTGTDLESRELELESKRASVATQMEKLKKLKEE